MSSGSETETGTQTGTEAGGQEASGPASSEAAAIGEAILRGDRRALARTITRLESTRDEEYAAGQAVLETLVPKSGKAIRVGITGPPGVGKSTFIEALGLHLVDAGQRVAVLAVDPSSPVTGGSILGDKTRMERLTVRPEAFIRPSPSSGSLGGVAHRTREAMLLCEAAGYDVVLIETVGIGQSEVAVASMVDFFLVLLLPSGGDELQGIKKGVIELADALVVNKADGPMEQTAQRTRVDYASALDLIRAPGDGWRPRALVASAAESKGIDAVWKTVLEHHALMKSTSRFEERRRGQARAWMWKLIEERIARAFRQEPGMAEAIATQEAAVAASTIAPSAAARTLLDEFESRLGARTDRER